MEQPCWQEEKKSRPREVGIKTSTRHPSTNERWKQELPKQGYYAKLEEVFSQGPILNIKMPMGLLQLQKDEISLQMGYNL